MRSALAAAVVSLFFLPGCGSRETSDSGGCEVTVAQGGVPESVRDFQQPVPWVEREQGWVFNDALAVNLPPDGVLPALEADDGEGLRIKFPWWRLVAGLLTAFSEPAAGGTQVPALVPEGYGEGGFQPSDLRFSESGCWRVTGEIAENS